MPKQTFAAMRQSVVRIAGRVFAAPGVAALGIAMAWITALSLVVAGPVATTAHAFSIEFKGRGVKRTILALYDSKIEPVPGQTRLHKLAEMPLNHLGFVLEYHDIRTPLPPPAEATRHRAVLSWFVEPLPDPLAYLTWLDAVTADGVRLVALGEVAPLETDETIPLLNRVLGRLGLRSASNFIELTHKSKVTAVDADMIGFEQRLDKVIPGFPVLEVLARTTRAHVTIDTETTLGVIRSHPVATSDQGGYAAQNYTITLDPNTNRLAWTLNPFRFFRLSLGDERFPIPDVTTMSGRRIYFSHIDGDGWNNMTEVEGYREHQAFSAEVVTREAIEPYPDLPVSVGLIAGDVQPLLGGNAAGIPWARRLYALPQVEVASHTHTHPYNWQYFEAYRRADEEARVKAYRPPDMPMRERVTATMMRVAGKTYVNPRHDPYVAGTDDLPRTYLREPFDLGREVLGALRFSEQFAPAGKRAALYLWSGDTTPFEGALAATRAAGVRNLNGGDSRLDREYPSVAYVPPIARTVGRQRQIFAVNSNENTYTNDWTGPFGGQMMLVHTLANTDSPRRLKGFNLYYHMYSGEKPASLRAIRHFLDMARQADVIPIAASHYAAMADNFFSVQLEQVDLFSWAVTNRGAVHTVRFDFAEKLAVDFAASTGVVGARRHEQALYVALDPAAGRAVVTLKARPERDPPATPEHAGEPLVTLVAARWQLADLRAGACAVAYTAQGYGRGDLVWQTAPGRGFKLTIAREGRSLLEQVRWSDASGLVSFRAEVDALAPVDVALACHD